MSDTKFTPGNWHWREDKWNGGWSGLYSDGDTPVLVPQSCNDGDDGDAWFATVDEADEEGLTDADRALIAAAPELFTTLKAIVDTEDDGLFEMLGDEFCGQIDRVLAKARGEA